MELLPEKGQRTLIWLLVSLFVLLLIAALGGSYYYYFQKKQKEKEANQSKATTTSLSFEAQSAAMKKISSDWGTVKSVSEKSLVIVTPKKQNLDLVITENTTIEDNSGSGQKLTFQSIKVGNSVSVSYEKTTKDALNVWVSGGTK